MKEQLPQQDPHQDLKLERQGQKKLPLKGAYKATDYRILDKATTREVREITKQFKKEKKLTQEKESKQAPLKDDNELDLRLN